MWRCQVGWLAGQLDWSFHFKLFAGLPLKENIVHPTDLGYWNFSSWCSGMRPKSTGLDWREELKKKNRAKEMTSLVQGIPEYAVRIRFQRTDLIVSSFIRNQILIKKEKKNLINGRSRERSGRKERMIQRKVLLLI